MSSIYGSKYSITSSNVSTEEIIAFNTAVTIIYSAIQIGYLLQQITRIVSNAKSIASTSKKQIEDLLKNDNI